MAQMPPFPFNTYRWCTLLDFTLDSLYDIRTNKVDVIELLNFTLYTEHPNAKYQVSPVDFIQWLVSEKICKKENDSDDISDIIIIDMEKFKSTFLKPSEVRKNKIEKENKSKYRLNYDMLYDLALEIRNNATVKTYPPYNKSAAFMLSLGNETDEMLDELITNNKAYITQSQQRIDLLFQYYSQLYLNEDKNRARYHIHCWQKDIKRYQDEIEYYDSLKTE